MISRIPRSCGMIRSNAERLHEIDARLRPIHYPSSFTVCSCRLSLFVGIFKLAFLHQDLLLSYNTTLHSTPTRYQYLQSINLQDAFQGFFFRFLLLHSLHCHQQGYQLPGILFFLHFVRENAILTRLRSREIITTLAHNPAAVLTTTPTLVCTLSHPFNSRPFLVRTEISKIYKNSLDIS